MNETEALVANLINPAIKKADAAVAPFYRLLDQLRIALATATSEVDKVWCETYAAEIRENE
jgi:hypothetical protein